MGQFGKENGAARQKLTNEQVREIKESYRREKPSYRVLGKEYGVAAETIARIIRGESRVNVVTAAEVRERDAERDVELIRKGLESLRRVEAILAEPQPTAPEVRYFPQLGVVAPSPPAFDHDLPDEVGSSGLDRLNAEAFKAKKSDILLDEIMAESDKAAELMGKDAV